MKITLFFTFLIINIANATLPTESGNAVETQQAYTYFRWNPYNLQIPTLAHQAAPFFTTLLPAPTPIGTRDHLAEHLPLSENRSETLLIDTQGLCDSHNITSSHTQQAHLDQLLKNYTAISTLRETILPDRMANVFEKLQGFLNFEYDRLGQKLSGNPAQLSEYQKQYNQLLIFCDVVTELRVFSLDQIKKLQCYQVSFLMGVANICGIKRDNASQLSHLSRALCIIRNIGTNVQDPYGIGMDFDPAVLNCVCTNKLHKTQRYLNRNNK